MTFSDEFGDYVGDEQNIIKLMMGICAYCGVDIAQDEHGYVDRTGGDCCSGDDNLVNENGMHEPVVSERDLEWAVCGTCYGKGTSSLYLGSFSTEQLWEDPEFAEEYMSGRYDKPCPECGGRTTVRQVREGAKHSDQIEEWFKGMYELRAEEASERRMGA